jgi:hypothetical protein
MTKFDFKRLQYTQLPIQPLWYGSLGFPVVGLGLVDILSVRHRSTW